MHSYGEREREREILPHHRSGMLVGNVILIVMLHTSLSQIRVVRPSFGTTTVECFEAIPEKQASNCTSEFVHSSHDYDCYSYSHCSCSS